MLKSLYVCATTAALALSASSGHAMSINIGAGVKPALDATDVIQKAAVYIVEGRSLLFLFRWLARCRLVSLRLFPPAQPRLGRRIWLAGLELRTRGEALRPPRHDRPAGHDGPGGHDGPQ